MLKTKNYLAIAVMVGCLGCPAYAQQKSPTENDHLYAASLSIAQRVCPAHPKATIWLFLDNKWGVYSCGPVNVFMKAHPVDDYFKKEMDYQQSVATLFDHVDKAVKAASK